MKRKGLIRSKRAKSKKTIHGDGYEDSTKEKRSPRPIIRFKRAKSKKTIHADGYEDSTKEKRSPRSIIRSERAKSRKTIHGDGYEDSTKVKRSPGRSSALGRRPHVEINVLGNRMIERYGTRDRRQHLARIFCDNYHDAVSTALKCHIVAGDPLKTLTEKSIKIPWVGVHGVDSICVVARSKDLRLLDQDRSMPPGLDIIHNNTSRFLFDIWNTLISQVEDIAAPSGKSRQMFNQSRENPYILGLPGPCQMLHKCSKRPLSVVSVIQEDMDKTAYKGSRAKYDVEGAIKFLQEEMESFSDFTFDTTTQAAVSAFQHLFRKKFKAHKIRVFVLKNDETHGRELEQSREDCGIEGFIDRINGRPRPSFI